MKIAEHEWRTLSALLDEALDLPVEARDVWVEGLAERYATLKPILRDLLAKQAILGTHDFLGGAPKFAGSACAGHDADGSAQLLVGSTIGAYRLVRELGRGGMGAVWLAERTDELIKRPVALKLPHPSLYDQHLAERFARERDILAALTHGNIARLYDVGVAPNGQPFLALEYVEGMPLTSYCDTRQLSIRERINLFMQVLRAVQYAHTHLVIHRDLKPSNILVTADGNVQLLDFGIAKLVTDSAAKESELTLLGGRAFTPDYASPEQITGQPISTASDVYSLGVILYELLTGELPNKLKRASRGALEEAILSADPLKPSHTARTGTDASARAMMPHKLAKLLRGDLDTIVLKALKKLPSERYATADAIAQDLQHFLRGEPVEARPDGAIYRLGKFAARNKVTMAAAAVAFLALAAGLALSLWQARVAREQAVAAQREAKKAKAVQAFLLDIFSANSHLQGDPLKARQTTARDLLDIGAARINENLKDVPEAEEEVLGTVGDMYVQLGLDREAVVLRLQRIEVLKKAYGARDPKVAQALIDYAEDISSSSERGNMLPALTEAKDILDGARDFSSGTRAWLWTTFARYYRYTSPEKMRLNADTAVKLLKEHPKDDWSLILAMQLAARARLELGEYEASEALYRDTLVDVRLREPGPSAWEIAPLAQMAGAQAELLKLDEAEANFRASLAISRKLNGDTHNETLQSESRLGAFLHTTSRRSEGRRLLESALAEIERDPSKKDNSVAAVVYGFYGQSLLTGGSIEAAEKFLALEVEDARRLYPESTPLAKGLLRQGVLYTALGRYGAAAQALDESLSVWRRIAGTTADPSQENAYLLAHARLDLVRGDATTAIDRLRQVRRPANAARLPLLLDETKARIEFAKAYLLENRVADAVAVARLALDDIQRSSVRDNFQTLEADAALRSGQALQRSGDLQVAHKNLERALQLREANDDGTSPWRAEAQIALADCLIDLGERERARSLFAAAAVVHAAQKELGEHFKKPLRALASRLQGGRVPAAPASPTACCD